MAFHHVALATKDIAATHDFYTRVMGFRLVKVEIAPTPGGGWAKHVFYDTGRGEMIAFWDLHDPKIGTSFRADHAQSLGLPPWVNHYAFAASTLDELTAIRTRWQEQGVTVLEIDHEWCTSIYATDPNGVLVEFCCTTREFTADEIAGAERALADPSPEMHAPPRPKVHRPLRKTGVAA
jgi:catechol 2,3-dioxygenase-like lactoylglutathione lyase family enzyme